MKLGMSLCLAVSLTLAVNVASWGTTQDAQKQVRYETSSADGQPQDQSQRGQNKTQQQQADSQSNNSQEQNSSSQKGNARARLAVCGSRPKEPVSGQRRARLAVCGSGPKEPVRGQAQQDSQSAAPGQKSQSGEIPYVTYGDPHGPQQTYFVEQRPGEQKGYVIAGNELSWREVPNQTVGMSLTSVDEALRDHLKLPKDQGLAVVALDPNCSAAQAGIQQNDILLKLGETPLAKAGEFVLRLKELGEKPVALTLLRGGKARTIHVQPVVRVTLQPVQPAPPAEQFWIGVSVTQIDPTLRSHLQLAPGQGLIVSEVVKDGPAEKAGLKRHDILMEMDGKPLSEPAAFAKAVQDNGTKSIVFRMIRKGMSRLRIEVKPERRKPAEVSVNVNDPKTFSFVALQPALCWWMNTTIKANSGAA